MGSRLFAANIAAEPTSYSKRLDDAGLVVLGKTTTSEFGLLGSTETLLEGVTRNPWDLGRSAGGSSGGSAAAVASRMVPMAHASDGGGSIRGPASMNGVFGFKPSKDRIVPSGPSDMDGIVTDHAVSVSVADSALLLSLTERTDGPHPPVGFVDGPSSERLRIGWYSETLFGAEPSAEVRRALESTVELCGTLGHTVVETTAPPISGPRVGDAFFTLAAEAMAGLSRMMEPMLGRPLDDRDLEPFTLELIAWFRRLPEAAVTRSRREIVELGAEMRGYLDDFDVVLSPTIPVEPWALGTVDPHKSREELLELAGAVAGYTAIHNMAGVPAMSVPLALSSGGLPIGSHFAGGLGQERTLLALAYELEEAAPWRQRLPVLPAR